MKSSRKRLWRRIRRTLYVLTGLAFLVPAIAFLVGYLVWDVTSPQQVLAQQGRTVVLAYSDGTPMTRIVPEDGDREFVRFADIPHQLVDAIVAVEDPTFWTNQGFEPTGVIRAMVTGVGGGSGITQQYIKNSTGDDEASFFRKFKELVLATKLTRQQSKQEIFESYINIVSFGRNTHGPAAAMNAYFGRPLAGISWSEAAFLAGMLQAPYGHDPATVGDDRAAKRWEYAADKLVQRGYVSPAERAAMSYPGGEIRAPGQAGAGKLSYSDYHIQQQVLAELEAKGMSLERMRREGATVRTTIDRHAQELARRTMHDRLAGEPGYFRAAVVRIDPRTGGVLAYEGGDWGVRDYAVTPHRPGTAFQPFETLAAAEFGSVTPERIRQAAYDAGIPEFLDGDRTLTGPDDDRVATTIGDGVYRLRPLDLTAAYATLASGGVRRAPHFLDETVGGVPAFGRASAKIAASFPGPGWVIAGEFRFRETNDNSDAWMISLTPDAVTATWVGADEERAMRDARNAKLTADTIPADIWRPFAPLAYAVQRAVTAVPPG